MIKRGRCGEKSSKWLREILFKEEYGRKIGGNDRLNLTSSFILPVLMGDKRGEAKVG